MKKMYIVREADKGKPQHVEEVTVTVDGENAFIHPRGKSTRAEIVPSENVFDTEQEAHKAMTKGGKLMWVLQVSHWHGSYQLVQAYVSSGRSYSWNRFYRIFLDEEGNKLELQVGMVFSTKTLALKHLAKKMHQLEQNLRDKEAEAERYRAAFEQAKADLRKARIGWKNLP
jgi:hypothetical protein